MSRRHPRCRKCGEPIDFMPYQAGPGVVKWQPVNLDNRQKHYARCQLTLDLRAARKKPPRQVEPQRSFFGTLTS